MEITALQKELTELYRTTLSYEFRRTTYEKKMESLKETYSDLLKKTAQFCEESDENREKIAECVPEYIMTVLEKEPSKRKRDFRLLDHKMNLVSWFIPFLGEMPSAEPGKLTGRIVEIWNEKMPADKIGHSTYESIRDGFKRGGSCYITTAVCRSLGKPDDCHELAVLRRYRDAYLMSDGAGRALVDEYYNIAPTIVKRIDRKADAGRIYSRIWKTYLNLCICLAEQGENEACREKYSEMVRELENEYLYSRCGYERLQKEKDR